MCILVKIWAKPVLVVVFGACICLAFVTFIIVQKGAVIAQWGNSADTLNFCDIPQAISKEDHKFLDELFQQQNLDNQRETNPAVKPGQNVAKAQSDSKPVPRAELIVNTSEVKRAQLVVNNRVVERAELVRPRNQ
jgi:hypothetical protein